MSVSSSQPSLVELLLYVSGGGKVAISDGRTMPSSRRYERNSEVRGMIRDLRVEDRYLDICQQFSDEQLGAKTILCMPIVV